MAPCLYIFCRCGHTFVIYETMTAWHYGNSCIFISLLLFKKHILFLSFFFSFVLFCSDLPFLSSFFFFFFFFLSLNSNSLWLPLCFSGFRWWVTMAVICEDSKSFGLLCEGKVENDFLAKLKFFWSLTSLLYKHNTFSTTVLDFINT